MLLGLPSAGAAGALLGFVAHVLNPYPGQDPLRYALKGAVVAFTYSIGLALRGLPLFLAAVLLWTLLARRYPLLEASRLHLTGSLASFAVLLAGLIALARPDDELAFNLLITTMLVAGLVLPRLLARVLSPGAFAAQ
jgi:hypothetical protein